MHDTDLEARLAGAVDDLEPSADLGDRIAGRVAQRARNQRAARVGVSAVRCPKARDDAPSPITRAAAVTTKLSLAKFIEVGLSHLIWR